MTRNLFVSTPEPFHTLFTVEGDGSCTLNYPLLTAAVDVVLVNIHPFHDSVPIEQAISKVDEQYNCAKQAVGPGKEVIISETGWPSAGEAKGEAVPSPKNFWRFLFELIDWAEVGGVEYFYFEAFDENWKGPEEFERHWGIWDSDGCIKNGWAFAVPVLSPWWLLALSTLLAAAASVVLADRRRIVASGGPGSRR